MSNEGGSVAYTQVLLVVLQMVPKRGRLSPDVGVVTGCRLRWFQSICLIGEVVRIFSIDGWHHYYLPLISFRIAGLLDRENVFFVSSGLVLATR